MIEPFLLKLFGKEFLSGAAVLIILSVGQFIDSFAGLVGIVLQMVGNQKYYRNIVFLALPLNLVLNSILTPKYGAIATIASMVLWKVLGSIYLLKKLDVITYYNFRYMDTIKKSKIPLTLVRFGDSCGLMFRFLFCRKPFMAKHAFPEPFFIVGSGRSGNTLLRSMLVAGEEVCIPPESYVWPRIIRIYATYNFLPWEKLCALVISEFEAYKEFNTWEVNLYEAHQNARELSEKDRSLSNIFNVVYNSFQTQRTGKIKRWGDKTPINTIYSKKIIKIFPQAQFVHILRDPKDVVCSYVNAGLYKNYEDAAEFWKVSVETALKMEKKLPTNQFHQIRYEELVSNPEKSLKTVSEFLGIHYSEKMLDFWKFKDDLGDVKKHEHHKNIGNPVSTASIGKWKKQLSKQEQQKIEAITNNTFQNACD